MESPQTQCRYGYNTSCTTNRKTKSCILEFIFFNLTANNFNNTLCKMKYIILKIISLPVRQNCKQSKKIIKGRITGFHNR